MEPSNSGSTPNQQHAARGMTRLSRAAIERPDTVIVLPSGQQMVLRRGSQPDSMPIFRKLTPKKFQRETSKTGRAAFSQARKVPFTQFLIAAFVLHQALGFLRGCWQRWQQRRSRQLVLVESSNERWEEEVPPEVLESDQRLRKELLPAMIRAAMPKPQHRSKAHEMAQAHRLKRKSVPTAGKMLRPSDRVARKQPGMLGRLDAAMRQQVRELALAQERAHHLQLEAAKQALLLQGAELPRLPASEAPEPLYRTLHVVQPAAVAVRKR